MQPPLSQRERSERIRLGWRWELRGRLLLLREPVSAAEWSGLVCGDSVWGDLRDVRGNILSPKAPIVGPTTTGRTGYERRIPLFRDINNRPRKCRGRSLSSGPGEAFGTHQVRRQRGAGAAGQGSCGWLMSVGPRGPLALTSLPEFRRPVSP